jgi:hypothetical protein
MKSYIFLDIKYGKTPKIICNTGGRVVETKPTPFHLSQNRSEIIAIA